MTQSYQSSMIHWIYQICILIKIDKYNIYNALMELILPLRMC